MTTSVRLSTATAIPGARPLPRLDYLLFVVPLAVLAVIALLPGMVAPSLDAAVFSVVGDRMAAGDLPYAQVFDHKPPGLYLLIAAGQVVGGSIGAWKISWILSVVAVVLTGVLVADTLRLVGWRRSAWLIGAICVALLASFPLALGGGLGETAAVLPAAAALRTVATGRVSSGRLFGAGALAAGAAAISLQAAPVLLAVLVVAALRRETPDRHIGHPRLLSPVWILVGASVISAVVVTLLGTAGATGAAIQAVVTYNRAFASLGTLDDPIVGQALHALLILSPLLIPAVIGLPYMLSRPSLRPIAVGAVTWLLGSGLLIALQGRLELHYATLLVPPLAVLAPAGLTFLHVNGPRPVLVRSAILVGLLATAFSLSGLLSATETTMAIEARTASAVRSQTVATWVNANTPADGTMFVWGNEPAIYLDTDRVPASAYVYLLPLTTPGYANERLIQGVLDEWVAKPPAAIVDAGSSSPGTAGMPPLLIARPTLQIDGRNVDLLDPLRDFVRERYVLATTIQGWPVYVPR